MLRSLRRSCRSFELVNTTCLGIAILLLRRPQKKLNNNGMWPSLAHITSSGWCTLEGYLDTPLPIRVSRARATYNVMAVLTAWWTLINGTYPVTSACKLLSHCTHTRGFDWPPCNFVNIAHACLQFDLMSLVQKWKKHFVAILCQIRKPAQTHA